MKYFNDLERYLPRVLKEARRLVKNSKELNLCSSKCASCLAAEARSNVDEMKNGKYYMGFSRGDVCMIEARKILAKELNWEVK